MVRINKIGKKFGLKCELREYLASSVRCLARRWLGGPRDVGVDPWDPREGQRGHETSWLVDVPGRIRPSRGTCRRDGASLGRA